MIAALGKNLAHMRCDLRFDLQVDEVALEAEAGSVDVVGFFSPADDAESDEVALEAEAGSVDVVGFFS